MAPDETFMFFITAGGFTLDDTSPTSAYTLSAGQFYFDNFSATGGVTGVPEPYTAGLLGIGAACLFVAAWRRKR